MHVEGTFGVFYEGTAALTAISPTGDRLAVNSYYASPSQPLVVDAEVPLPVADQTRLVLEVLDSDGAVVGTLDTVTFAAPAAPTPNPP